MGKFDEFALKNLSKQGKRFLREWMEVDKLCKNNKRISYIVRKKNYDGLPVEYEIIFRVRCIIGVEEPKETEVTRKGETVVKKLRHPIYGETHRMKLILPNNFPSARGNPQLFFLSDIWHPNIRSAGKFKGRVCTNEKDLGITTNLATRIIRIGQYLQYQLYHAEDIYPYPEDSTVAEWVREEAEPMGWVSMSEGIFTDTGNLKEKEFSKTKVLVVPKSEMLKASGKNTLRI